MFVRLWGGSRYSADFDYVLCQPLLMELEAPALSAIAITAPAAYDALANFYFFNPRNPRSRSSA
jgi:hypothetical protein